MKCSKRCENNYISARKEVFFMCFCDTDYGGTLPGRLYSLCIINKCKIIIKGCAQECVSFLNLLRSKVKKTYIFGASEFSEVVLEKEKSKHFRNKVAKC